MPKKKINVADLKQIARYQAVRYLVQENVTSVGVGYKVKDGKQTNELCIQFTVGQKIALESLDGAGLAELPRSFKVGDVEIPTDVIERSYKHSGQQIEVKRKPNRKARMDPIQPGQVLDIQRYLPEPWVAWYTAPMIPRNTFFPIGMYCTVNTGQLETRSFNLGHMMTIESTGTSPDDW